MQHNEPKAVSVNSEIVPSHRLDTPIMPNFPAITPIFYAFIPDLLNFAAIFGVNHVVRQSV
jgi:hypothetical protein